MTYQDTWVNGRMVAKGNRECEKRYSVIRDYLTNRDQQIKSVLDIGANMCYFGLRLIEDFGCSVMAFEFNGFDMRMAHVKANKTKKLMLLNRKLSISDLDILASCTHFDVVLAISVLHHLPGDSQQWVDLFRRLGGMVIIEFALTDSTRSSIRPNYAVPHDATIIGYGDSHLKKNFKRPIVCLKQK